MSIFQKIREAFFTKFRHEPNPHEVAMNLPRNISDSDAMRAMVEAMTAPDDRS